MFPFINIAIASLDFDELVHASAGGLRLIVQYSLNVKHAGCVSQYAREDSIMA